MRGGGYVTGESVIVVNLIFAWQSFELGPCPLRQLYLEMTAYFFFI